MAEAAEGRIANEVLFMLMLYKLPNFIELILPLGLFLGILLAYGRLYLDNEMAVLNACGFSQKQLVGFTLIPIACTALAVGVLSLWVGPWGMKNSEQILFEQQNQSAFETLAPGRFHNARGQNQVIYVENLSRDRRRMENLFIVSQEPEKIVLVAAKSGVRKIDPELGIQYMELRHGHRYEGFPGRAGFRVIEYETYKVKLDEPDISKEVQKVLAMPTTTLARQSTPLANAELQWRISLPLLVPIVALMAIPLSRVNPRQGRYLKMFPAILLYLAYLTLLGGGKSALENGQLPQALGLWPVHLLFLAIAVLLNLWPGLKLRRLRT